MTTRNQAIAGLATAILLSAQALAAPSLGVSAPHLTTASVASLAARDARAAAVINAGDSVKASGCRAVRGGAFTCRIELIPVHSTSRCRWTDTIRLVRGKPKVVGYSTVKCSD